MRKNTRAYRLKAMKTPVFAFQYKDKWYPSSNNDLFEKEIFIRGEGWIKILQKMKKGAIEVHPLPDDWTAQDIKDRVDEYGLDVAMGLLHGEGMQSLFEDGSIGLNWHKHEFQNMANFGKIYDEFTDKVDEVGKRFVSALFKKGYASKGGDWLFYGNELITQLKFEPLEHVHHNLKGIFHTRPSFDPIQYDKVLATLMMAQCDTQEDKITLLDKYVSIKERIEYLSSKEIADDMENIFEWQEAFYDTEKK